MINDKNRHNTSTYLKIFVAEKWDKGDHRWYGVPERGTAVKMIYCVSCKSTK